MQMLEAYSAQLLSVLRIMTGLLFLQHGTSKYLGFPASKFSGVSLMTMGGVAGMFELVGGILIVLGLFTRLVAFVLSVSLCPWRRLVESGSMALQVRLASSTNCPLA